MSTRSWPCHIVNPFISVIVVRRYVSYPCSNLKIDSRDGGYALHGELIMPLRSPCSVYSFRSCIGQPDGSSWSLCGLRDNSPKSFPPLQSSEPFGFKIKGDATPSVKDECARHPIGTKSTKGFVDHRLLPTFVQSLVSAARCWQAWEAHSPPASLLKVGSLWEPTLQTHDAVNNSVKRFGDARCRRRTSPFKVVASVRVSIDIGSVFTSPCATCRVVSMKIRLQMWHW